MGLTTTPLLQADPNDCRHQSPSPGPGSPETLESLSRRSRASQPCARAPGTSKTHWNKLQKQPAHPNTCGQDFGGRGAPAQG